MSILGSKVNSGATWFKLRGNEYSLRSYSGLNAGSDDLSVVYSLEEHSQEAGNNKCCYFRPSLKMKQACQYYLISLLFIFLILFCRCTKVTPNLRADMPVITTGEVVHVWETTADQSKLLTRQADINFSSDAVTSETPIIVDENTTFQTIDGFGFALTGGSASLINGMGAAQDAYLTDIFSPTGGHMGSSFIRITIGASDLSATDFTYDDLATGQTDLTLSHFSISREMTDLIPVLKKIIAINPAIKILATPWTAPVWMKTGTLGNGGFTGGSLNTAYYDVYARYFTLYVQAMQAQGIPVFAITPQNEPLNAYNNPAMTMQADEETNFIKNNLGPAFLSAGITTKIIAYDHNCDEPQYPEKVLADLGARRFIDGSAFHLYAGDISALTRVHTAYPEKNIYFTEQYIPGPGNFSTDFAYYINKLIIGAPRNWSRIVILWNLAADADYNPHTQGGCNTCMGATTITGSTYIRNTAYYTVAQASQFVKSGAVRIASSTFRSEIQHVAFKNPDGSKVLIALNTNTSSLIFTIKCGSSAFTYTLPGKAAATFTWI